MAEEEQTQEEQQTQGGPSGLRAHVKDLEKELRDLRSARDTELSELTQYRRERAFEAALSEAKVEGVSLADLGELPPDQITPSLVKAKAGEKEDQRRAQLVEQAKAFGFDTVEEYQSVLDIAREAKAKAAQEQATATSVAMGAPGQPPPSKRPAEIGMEAHDAARARGVPKDYAEAEFVSATAKAFLENQGLSAPAGGRT